jgi:predicted tellurium resistance membrane protein TerC
MDIFFLPETWIALLTLTIMEIVLGVDNIIFISIISNKLPEEEQRSARLIGLSLALITRIVLLASISYIIKLTEPLFILPIIDLPLSARDLILFGGGLFLIGKSTLEIGHKMEVMGVDQEKEGKSKYWSVVPQIILLDIIFSFDSILTAIGLSKELVLMVTAVVISMIIMMLFSGKISGFIKKHPSLEILALSFLILIGVMLTVEAFHNEVPKGYIYFAVFFSLAVEVVNIGIRKRKRVVRLNKRIEQAAPRVWVERSKLEELGKE